MQRVFLWHVILNCNKRSRKFPGSWFLKTGFKILLGYFAFIKKQPLTQ